MLVLQRILKYIYDCSGEMHAKVDISEERTQDQVSSKKTLHFGELL